MTFSFEIRLLGKPRDVFLDLVTSRIFFPSLGSKMPARPCIDLQSKWPCPMYRHQAVQSIHLLKDVVFSAIGVNLIFLTILTASL